MLWRKIWVIVITFSLFARGLGVIIRLSCHHIDLHVNGLGLLHGQRLRRIVCVGWLGFGCGYITRISISNEGGRDPTVKHGRDLRKGVRHAHVGFLPVDLTEVPLRGVGVRLLRRQVSVGSSSERFVASLAFCFVLCLRLLTGVVTVPGAKWTVSPFFERPILSIAVRGAEQVLLIAVRSRGKVQRVLISCDGPEF
jgi:hypothetical protein